MERVSVILGKLPILLVATHGNDDTNTDILTETAAQQLGCNAVINRGFDRTDVVDVNNDKADCNRVDHVKQDVVYDEFLRPIERFETKFVNKSSKLQQTWPYSYNPDPIHIFYIHGCGNAVHKEANEPVEVIIGHGLGIKKNSLTCDNWRKNLFTDMYRKYASYGDVFEGISGGKYAGRDSNNMNQYFRKHCLKSWVHSMQLEYPYSLRDNRPKAISAGCILATVLSDYLQHKSYALQPTMKFI